MELKHSRGGGAPSVAVVDEVVDEKMETVEAAAEIIRD
jgi:hypothetical protein